VRGLPRMRTVPAPGRRNPAASPKVVVFPAPFGPTRPWQLPERTWKLTRSRATVLP
jgi:hypothetical protein